MKKKYIIIDSKDNCATALEDIPQDTKISFMDKSIKIHQRIPLGHKFAISNIKKEEYIVKYGENIGIATEDINVGDWIHIHNIKSTYMEVKEDE